MIDLETLSSDNNAVITSIGAVSFDMSTLEIGSTFKVNVDPASHEKLGGKISASTFLWWLKQSPEAQQAMLTDPQPLDKALAGLTRWMQAQAGTEPIHVWGNGIDFDGTVLRNAYKAAGMWEPWKYSNGRCFRTMKNVFKIVPEPLREGVHHDSLADAMHQTRWLIDIFTYIRSSRRSIGESAGFSSWNRDG